VSLELAPARLQALTWNWKRPQEFEDKTWKWSCVVTFMRDCSELFKLTAVMVKLTVMRLMSASDHEILREPTPFSVTIRLSGELGGPTEVKTNMHGSIIIEPLSCVF
jgi:hypothetical protein